MITTDNASARKASLWSIINASSVTPTRCTTVWNVCAYKDSPRTNSDNVSKYRSLSVTSMRFIAFLSGSASASVDISILWDGARLFLNAPHFPTGMESSVPAKLATSWSPTSANPPMLLYQSVPRTANLTEFHARAKMDIMKSSQATAESAPLGLTGTATSVAIKLIAILASSSALSTASVFPLDNSVVLGPSGTELPAAASQASTILATGVSNAQLEHFLTERPVPYLRTQLTSVPQMRYM